MSAFEYAPREVPLIRTAMVRAHSYCVSKFLAETFLLCLRIRQMTPFISESVLKRLPSLPKQHALIFGNAVNLPATFRVRDVDPKPKSDDAAIRELWFRSKDAQVELAVPEERRVSAGSAVQE